MKKNDRVQSQYNTGTIRRITDDIVTVHWDGFISPIDLPRELVETYPIVGEVAPEGWDKVEA